MFETRTYVERCESEVTLLTLISGSCDNMTSASRQYNSILNKANIIEYEGNGLYFLLFNPVVNIFLHVDFPLHE